MIKILHILLFFSGLLYLFTSINETKRQPHYTMTSRVWLRCPRNINCSITAGTLCYESHNTISSTVLFDSFCTDAGDANMVIHEWLAPTSEVISHLSFISFLPYNIYFRISASEWMAAMNVIQTREPRNLRLCLYEALTRNLIICLKKRSRQKPQQ